ncbi:hypothetical protein [Paenarthrobacter nitroguajacolicus]|uniref:hypothetical protein n=1 Tax=Paenarthrobacter nitroguajacolicus TaxID=211146 RepID=UPI00248BF6D3|nr:hypothetical protein [Paenarthrobacter nitroguajacolicus]MDI2034855.1 hypothetical protein [Paenarthrobacter nitroguajacolicus]
MRKLEADSRLNIVEVSGLAWAESVRRAAETLGNEADFADYQASLPEQGVRSPETGDELRRAGILDAHGVMSPQWVLAVALAASAPVKASTVVQFRDTVQFKDTVQLRDAAPSGDAVRPEEHSVHTEIGLAGGRGVGVSYQRRISHQADGAGLTEVRNAVEVSFFQEEDAWAALSRQFPDLSQLDGQHGATPGETAADTTCTIHLGVSATPTGQAGSRPYARGRVWAVADRLYSVDRSYSSDETPEEDAPVSLAAVPATDIGREFAWSLLGAREYLGSAADGSVRA